MEISFGTIEIRELCEKEEVAFKAYGMPNTRALQSLLADIDAAKNLTELEFRNYSKTHFQESNAIEFKVTENLFIALKSNHPKHLKSIDNSIDWSKVSRVQIIQIKYNGE